MSIFFEIHQAIPREGPGNAEATRHALSLLQLPEQPRVLNIGCGPGADAMVLAEQLADSRITALDLHQPFLDDFSNRAEQAGVSGRIEMVHGDMKELDAHFQPETFDLIWSEGAIYIMGFANGLSSWQPLLKKGGWLVVSELSWLTDEPSPEAKAFWLANYPAIQTIEQNKEAIRAAGYELVDHFVLPEAGWWDDYYCPLEKNIAVLRQKYAGDAEVGAQLDEAQQEIDLYREHADSYGYVFYLMKKQI